MRAIWRSLGVAALAAIGASALHAAPADDFYKGKQIILVLSTDVGGGYAASANAIIPYLSANIPGKPRIIMQNMPGAGGVRAMNYMFSAAPKDGTRIATGAGDVALCAALRCRRREIRSAPDALDRVAREEHRHLRRLVHIRASARGRTSSTNSSSSAHPARARRWRRCR